MKSFSLISVIILLGCAAAKAAQPLEIIYDSGQSLPVAPYMSDDQSNPQQSPVLPTEQLSTYNPFDFGFPVISKNWHKGTFTRKAVGLRGLPHPFFVVGCDQESLDWIEHRREALEAIKALGFVIQCNDRNTMTKLQEISYPIVLQPMEADGMGTKIGHFTYPALITKRSIEQ